MEPRDHWQMVNTDGEVNTCSIYKSCKKPQDGAGCDPLPTSETLIKLRSLDLTWCLKSQISIAPYL